MGVTCCQVSHPPCVFVILNMVLIAGGGVIHMEVQHTLAVDGYIKANSENTGSNSNGASGGSGGSIIIETHNFTGNFSKRKYTLRYKVV